jgi:hypothetical protein
VSKLGCERAVRALKRADEQRDTKLTFRGFFSLTVSGLDPKVRERPCDLFHPLITRRCTVPHCTSFKMMMFVLFLALASSATAFQAAQRLAGSSVRLSMSVVEGTPSTIAPGSLGIIAEGTPFAAPKIGQNIVDVIGRTPMIRLGRLGSGAIFTSIVNLQCFTIVFYCFCNRISFDWNKFATFAN